MEAVMEQTTDKNDAGTVQSIIGAEYITPENLAKDLGRSVRTLARWNSKRVGPPQVRVGRLILYRRESVSEWLRDREAGRTRRSRRARA